MLILGGGGGGKMLTYSSTVLDIYVRATLHKHLPSFPTFAVARLLAAPHSFIHSVSRDLAFTYSTLNYAKLQKYDEQKSLSARERARRRETRNAKAKAADIRFYGIPYY